MTHFPPYHPLVQLIPQGPDTINGRPVNKLHPWHLWGLLSSRTLPFHNRSGHPSLAILQLFKQCHTCFQHPSSCLSAPTPLSAITTAKHSSLPTSFTSQRIHNAKDETQFIRYFPSSLMPITSTNRVHQSHRSQPIFGQHSSLFCLHFFSNGSHLSPRKCQESSERHRNSKPTCGTHLPRWSGCVRPSFPLTSNSTYQNLSSSDRTAYRAMMGASSLSFRTGQSTPHLPFCGGQVDTWRVLLLELDYEEAGSPWQDYKAQEVLPLTINMNTMSPLYPIQRSWEILTLITDAGTQTSIIETPKVIHYFK